MSKDAESSGSLNIEDTTPAPTATGFYDLLLNPKFRETIEMLGKMALALAALCYGFGLVVVNVYLSKFGVYSIDLFRVHYITAGMWALIDLTLPALLILIFTGILVLSNQKLRKYLNSKFTLSLPLFDDRSRLFEELEQNPKLILKNEQSFLSDTFLAFVGILLLVVLAGSLFYRIWQYAGWNGIGALLLSLIWGAIYVLLFAFCAFITFYVKSNFLSRLAKGYLLILLIIIGTLAQLTSFAEHVYGYIPTYLGGGSPRVAQMFIKTDPTTKAYLTSMGISFQGDTDLTQNVNVLLATETEFLIAIEIPNGEKHRSMYKGMTIRRDLVQAVNYSGVSLW